MNAQMESTGQDQQRSSASLDALLLRSGIDSALIGVPKLSRVLGLGASTIYTYMRENRFFLPYRMVNATPMVKIDDLVDWYLCADAEISPAKSAQSAPSKLESQVEPALAVNVKVAPAKRGRKQSIVRIPKAIEYRPLDVATQAAADQAVDELVAGVMERIERRQAQTASRCA